MNTSTTEIRIAKTQYVIVTEDSLTGDLTDGRTISVPIVWCHWLLHGTLEERKIWHLIGGGEVILGLTSTRIYALKICWPGSHLAKTIAR